MEISRLNSLKGKSSYQKFVRNKQKVATLSIAGLAAIGGIGVVWGNTFADDTYTVGFGNAALCSSIQSALEGVSAANVTYDCTGEPAQIVFDSEADANNIVSLELALDAEVDDFSGLSKFNGLHDLTVKDSSVALTDGFFTEVNALPVLNVLNLDGSTLATVTTLNNLQNNNITTLSLNHVNIPSGQLANLDFATNMPQLTTLNINDNNYTDLDGIESLTNLSILRAGSNSIADASALSGLTNLRTIDLENNKLTDVDFVENLSTPASWDLSGNKILDIEPILTHSGLADITADLGSQTQSAITHKTTYALPELMEAVTSAGADGILDDGTDSLAGTLSTTNALVQGSTIRILNTAEDAAVTVNGGVAGGTTLTLHYSDLNLVSIVESDAVTVAHGTELENINLPDTVTVNLSNGTTQAVEVDWDTDGVTGYDINELEEQSFEISGEITLPVEIGNENDAETTTTVSVTVEAAERAATPIPSVVAGTYDAEQSVELTSTADDATIYYTIDGSEPTTSSNEYSAAIEVTGAEGQSVETTIRAISVKDGMRVSEEMSATYTIEIPDTTMPTGFVTIAENNYTNFLNAVTFGLLFQNAQDVVITAEDHESGLASVGYYIANTALSEAEVAAITDEDWTPYTEMFSLPKDGSYIVYARIADNAGNTTYINSDGVVIYTEPAATEDEANAAKAAVEEEADLAVPNTGALRIENNDGALSGATFYVVLVALVAGWATALKAYRKHKMEYRVE